MAVELQSQLFGRVLAIAVDADRLVAGATEAVEQADVDRRFQRASAIAISHGESGRIALGERGGAAGLLRFGERLFYRRDPAAHHLLQLAVERCFVGHDATIAQVERDAQQGEAAFLKRDGPAEHRRIGGLRKHVLHREAAGGAEFVAR